MQHTSLRSIWTAANQIKPALLTGVVLCLAGYAIDLIFDKLGIPIAATILNNLIIGFLGALLVMFYLSENYKDHEMARARERMALVAELNKDIRDALVMIGYSASLDDRHECLQRVDEAMAQIDVVLTDLIPARRISASSANSV